VAHALQNDKIPDRNTTVFAGQDKAAVARVRELMVGTPPSSPCIGLFKDGKPVKVLQRTDIENKTAAQVAAILKNWFDEYCGAQGPSIPPEEFAKLTPYQACGSQIPLM
jgi:putative YphP/YqiW family bacilliredoxin